MATVTEQRPCIGVLLAGGLSSRMGRDKALLDWRGRPLIEHQLDTLRAAGVDELRVSGARPDYHGVADLTPQLGPVGGLASVVAGVADEAELLVIPVDMPRLSGSLLRRLRRERPSARSLRLAGHVLPWRVRLDVACRATLATPGSCAPQLLIPLTVAGALAMWGVYSAAAVSGSLRPLPVRMATARPPRIRPSRPSLSRPATLAALAGSQKSPSRLASSR